MIKAEKQKRKNFDDWLFSVAVDISTSEPWRQLLFSSEYDKKFLIVADPELPLPEYLEEIIQKNNVQFYVSKISHCPEKRLAEEGGVVFKFESPEFPDMVRFTAN